jgi:SAM-dependent methyltransferase
VPAPERPGGAGESPGAGDPGAPSPWLERHRAALAEAARGGPVLDLACGRGRHARAALALGAAVLAMDRDADALAALRRGAGHPARLLPVRTDLETDAGIAVRTGSCAAILVFCFLFRPLAPEIERALAPGGLLLYETFTEHQRDLPYGPSNPAFLLAPGELPALFPGLEPLAHEEGWTDGPRPSALARLAARKPG